MWSLDNKHNFIRMQADSMEYRNNIDQTSLISFAIFATFSADVGLNVTRFFKNDRMLSASEIPMLKTPKTERTRPDDVESIQMDVSIRHGMNYK